MATVPNTFWGLPLTPFPIQRRRNHRLVLLRSNGPSQFSISTAQPFRSQFVNCRKLKRSVVSSAYITGPAFDAFVSESDPKFEESDDSLVAVQPIEVIRWGFIWKLVSRHKLKLLASVFSLVICTTCSLSLPLLSGRFFEVLIGTRTDPLLELLSKVALLYTLEPIFTIIYVANITSIWEKVMSSLRAQIFRRVLIQKIDFFDRYKVPSFWPWSKCLKLLRELAFSHMLLYNIHVLFQRKTLLLLRKQSALLIWKISYTCGYNGF